MKIKDITEPIEGVIFDMDGLLVNSEKLYWDANIVAAKEANLDIPDDSYLKLVGSSVKEMEEFYHRHFKTKADRDKFIKRTDELVWKWTDEGKLKLQPGVLEALQLFKKKQVKLAIASSNYDEVVAHNLDVLKIKDYFDFYLSYKDVEAGKIKAKPAPDIYLLAAKKMQLPTDNLLVFEDSSTGVAAASAAGLKCVMVPDLKQATDLDKKNVTLICKDFYTFIEKIE
ncbi:MAG: HAD family phosphatase [Lactobacillus sp.]|uniref:HAD family hydrolase n=1 Tax=Lactobacillus sp. TaxID=1591 RepID=UPI0023CCF195|nr:HAD family phosphatase [Lactobacillus sp.]MDE7050138.1 HAD family phosphatase [Lactobacillus sp.]